MALFYTSPSLDSMPLPALIFAALLEDVIGVGLPDGSSLGVLESAGALHVAVGLHPAGGRPGRGEQPQPRPSGDALRPLQMGDPVLRVLGGELQVVEWMGGPSPAEEDVGSSTHLEVREVVVSVGVIVGIQTVGEVAARQGHAGQRVADTCTVSHTENLPQSRE